MAQHNTTFEFLKGYQPIKILGAGSFGVVFQAQRQLFDEETGEQLVDENGAPETEMVAVKKIPDYRCESRGQGKDYKEKFLRRVCREVDILLHFNAVEQVVEIKEVYHSKNDIDLYIVMTYVDISWDKLMRLPENEEMKNFLKEEHIRWMMCQLLLGLNALHGSGCMHRDLSLGNVLMDKSTFACYIADFGLSRVQFAADEDISLDVVSLPYRAPEVLIQVKRYTHVVDVWSAGCILMELCLKKPFLHGKDALRQLWAIMDNASGFPDLSQWQDIASGTAFAHLKSVQEKKTRELPSPKDVGATLIDAGYSAECADVARRMLVFHPHQRAKVKELLTMPWFANNKSCKEAIDAAAEKEKEYPLGECPSEIEKMNYEELAMHMRENLSTGVDIAGAVPL